MAVPFHLIDYLGKKRQDGVIVWLMNIGVEKYWNRLSPGIVDRNEERIVNRVEEMNLLLCREQDILILRHQPDPAFLAQLKSWGFSIPTILTPRWVDAHTPISELVLGDEDLLQQLTLMAHEREDIFFVPYGVSSLEEQIASRCGLTLIGAPSSLQAVINDKVFNRQIAQQLQMDISEGYICEHVEQIKEACHTLLSEGSGFSKVIIKEPHGASGKGLYLIDDPSRLTPLLARFTRTARTNSDAKWLVEGWYEKRRI
ncbi:preATP grasp domain-containing protein [Paenibacillus hexagrammi]|uniref:Pre ATP-grasp domain-containing protein n=1 Tax=Paenibacillus hexagrammi TaxID=2908839 RepID=A0ABY3SEJ6_9BACL|nr:hypothetical protein [Paenibacillus sp. YPD9-1]UJF31347.1 hypothetical protein L0M14_16040 [Paenibacillus sp. YPD9-1]